MEATIIESIASLRTALACLGPIAKKRGIVGGRIVAAGFELKASLRTCGLMTIGR